MTDRLGLSDEEAKTRLNEFGPNRLPSEARHGFFRLVLRQFFSPLIYILLAVAVLSIFLSHGLDAGFVLAVLVFNALIGAVQEYQAERSAAALRKMAATRASVIRNGVRLEIDAEELVPGDLVLLESGNKVPADLQLVDHHALEVDESLLTGESFPVLKDPSAANKSNGVLSEQFDRVFAGTLIARGRGAGIVLYTGASTELGRLAQEVFGSSGGRTPLTLRMERFTRWLALLLVAAVFLIGIVLLGRGDPLIEVVLVATALGVAVIPEGLPAALTITLAIASRKMAKRNVIVRKLSAVEALGSCTFIATDKTGTLTLNELTVTQTVLREGTDSDSLKRDLLLASVLSSEAVSTTSGDPVDRAILEFAARQTKSWEKIRSEYRLISRIPYEPQVRFAASLHEYGDGHGKEERLIISMKGAPETVLQACEATDHERASILKQVLELAAQGFRVIAVASGRVAATDKSLSETHLRGLRYLGLLGLQDPLRPDAKEAIKAAHRAGIQVAMLTGDHPHTARSIAIELGLIQPDGNQEVITGAMLREISDHQSLADLKRSRVFARLEPSQKLQLVKILIEQGHFVAVTGDGANDAPALKAAHVGVAMGLNGTDVAKESADLILADDRFSSIVMAVQEGRIAYSNVRKVIYLLVATGMGEIFLIFFCVFSGLPLPLSAVQLLWLNLVTEGVQSVALAFEPGEGDELNRRPRDPKEPIFDRLMVQRVVLSALVMGSVGFLFYRSLLNRGLSLAAAQNLVLLLMVLFENVMIGNARSERRPGWKMNPFTNSFLLLGAIFAQLLHVSALHIPVLQKVLGTAPVSFHDWVVAVGLASSVFLAIEIHKILLMGQAREDR